MNTYRYAKARAFIISGAVLLVFLLVPAILTAFFSSAAQVFARSNLTVLSNQLFTAAGYLLALFLIILRYKKNDKPVAEITGIYLRRFLQWNVPVYIGAGLFLGTAISCGLTLLPDFLTKGYSSSLNIVNGGAERFVWLTTILIITPVAEEIVFRRFILGALCEAFKPRIGLLISAAVFGVLHVQPLWILYAFAMGLLLGKLALDNNDLTKSISMHLGFNASILPMLLLKPGTAAYDFLFGSTLRIALCFAACTAAGAFLVFKLTGHDNKKTTIESETAV